LTGHRAVNVAAVFRFVAALVVTMAVFAACNQAERAALRVAITAEPASLDPSLATDIQSFYVLGNLFEGLTRYGDNLAIEGGVAERWEFNNDRTQITYYLRDDARWSDGEPVTADAFVYAWRRLLDPETAAEYAYFLYDVASAIEVNEGTAPVESLGVRAPDPHTLVVDLARPAAFFPHITTFMATFPLREDVITAHPLDWTEPTNIVGNGPYVLRDWRHDERLRLSKNPHYPDAAPLPSADFVVVRDAGTAWALYETQQIDVVLELLPLAIPFASPRDDYRNVPLLEVRYVAFDQAHPPFDDPNVRRAFALALDRDALANVLGGGQVPQASWLPPGVFGHNPATALQADHDAARVALAEAGYPAGAGFPTVELLFRTGDDWRLMAEALQSQWQQVLGVQIDVVVHDNAAFFRRIAEDSPPPMHLARWIADYPDPENFMSLFTTTSGNNNTGFSDARFDELVSSAVALDDGPERAAAYDEAQRRMLVDNVAIAPLFVNAQNAMVSPRLEYLDLNALGVLQLRTARLAPEAR
jgi:oligopeptide transport system substrate-binding protein